MFAYVKFIEDGLKTVVETVDIKKFDPAKMSTRKFQVKYDGEFYEAQVLKIHDDKEKLLDEVQKKRVHTVPSQLLETDVDDERDSLNLDTPPVHKKKNKSESKSKQKTAEKENYAFVLNEVNNNSDKDLDKTKQKLQETKEELEETKAKLTGLKNELNELKEQNILLESKVVELRDTNFLLQQNILDDWQKLTKQIQTILNKSQEAQTDDNAIIKELPEVGARTSENVHCGRNVWIPTQVFDSLLAQSKSNSVFVRDLAEFIFGQKVLKESSVTGKPCNRTGETARPALDGTKLMALHDMLRYKLNLQGAPENTIVKECNTIKSILSQKIIDLKRGPRQKKAKKQTVNVQSETNEVEINNNEHNETSDSSSSE